MVACAAATPADNLANVQLPRKGTIKQIQFSTKFILETDGSYEAQIALNRPSAQTGSSIGTPTGVLCHQGEFMGLTTSGISNSGLSTVIPMNIQVSPNDTIYLHAGGSGSNSLTATALIFVEE